MIRARVLRTGLRYRFSAGLRRAMKAWTAVIVGVVAIADVQSVAAFFSRANPAVLALALGAATQPLLKRILRSHHEQSLTLLPSQPLERRVLDFLSVEIFLLPPHLTAIAALAAVGKPFRAMEMAVCLLAGAVLQTMLLGAPSSSEVRGRSRTFSVRLHEVRWLLRMGRSRLITANVLALAALGCGELAIRNNDVVRVATSARISCAFLALGAAFLAEACVAARNDAIPWRSLELALPLSSASRVRSMLGASIVIASPALLAVAILRPVALPFTAALLVALALRGDSRYTLFAIAAAVGLVAALDARVALAAVCVALPWLWGRAL